jgi:hypothetical protein
LFQRTGKFGPIRDVEKDYAYSGEKPGPIMQDFIKTMTETEYMDDACRTPLVEKRIEAMILNMEPAHPAAHGVLRLVLELQGEVTADSSFILLLRFSRCHARRE